MKRRHLVIFLALFLLASGCTTMPERESPTPPISTQSTAPTPPPTPIPSSAPEPLTPERAAVLYTLFLQEDLPEEQGGYPFSLSYDMDRIKSIFYTRDLTGDGIPELYIQVPGIHEIWSIEDSKVISVGGLDGYDTVLPNGGIFYDRLDGAPMWQRYYYTGFSPESKKIPDISLCIYDVDDDGIRETYTIDGEEVSQEAWQETADVYFALRDAEPTEEQREIPFLDWVASLDVTLPEDILTEKKASNLYKAFFCGRAPCRGQNGEDVWLHEMPWEEHLGALNIWDFDGDGIPEVYLPDYTQEVWGIEARHVVLLGTLDEMPEQPEQTILFEDWYSAPWPEA